MPDRLSRFSELFECYGLSLIWAAALLVGNDMERVPACSAKSCVKLCPMVSYLAWQSEQLLNSRETVTNTFPVPVGAIAK